MFENRIVSSQPKAIEGCDTLLKRNIDTILLSNTKITFVISVLQQYISVKCTTEVHTGCRCPFKKWIRAASNVIALIPSRSSFWQFFYFWSWMLKGRIEVQEKKTKVVLCSRPPENVKLGIFTSQSCSSLCTDSYSDGNKMYKKAWCTCISCFAI